MIDNNVITLQGAINICDDPTIKKGNPSLRIQYTRADMVLYVLRYEAWNGMRARTCLVCGIDIHMLTCCASSKAWVSTCACHVSLLWHTLWADWWCAPSTTEAFFIWKSPHYRSTPETYFPSVWAAIANIIASTRFILGLTAVLNTSESVAWFLDTSIALRGD